MIQHEQTFVKFYFSASQFSMAILMADFMVKPFFATLIFNFCFSSGVVSITIRSIFLLLKFPAIPFRGKADDQSVAGILVNFTFGLFCGSDRLHSRLRIASGCPTINFLAKSYHLPINAQITNFLCTNQLHLVKAYNINKHLSNTLMLLIPVPFPIVSSLWFFNSHINTCKL